MPVFPDLFSISGKTAIVTGAALGIGQAITLAFAEAGAQVVAVDRDGAGAEATAQRARAAGGKVLAIEADVADRASVEAMTKKAKDALGRLDILINAAGITKRFPATDFPEEEWDRIIAVNLKGTFLCCQAIGREMVAQNEGRIVNLASIGGMVGYADTIAYMSSKGGVVQMTRGLAAEWGKHKVTVNAIAPGVVLTPMQEKLRGENPEKFNFFISRMAIGEPSTPEHIAAAALYLSSPAAALVTGHILAVDGGYLAM